MVALLLPGVAGGTAGAKTKTFSSGKIDRTIPDPVGLTGTEIAPYIQVRRGGRVRDVNVAVRISHPDAQELQLGVSHIPPNGVLRLGTLKDGGTLLDPIGADFGTGAPACKGAFFTVFDTQAPTSILDGAPPFAGPFSPAGTLNRFNGVRLRGKWWLDLLDVTDGDVGVLNCWRITVRYKPPRKRNS